MELEGKVAIVTGASRGIGAAVARELAAGGARVVVNYRSGRAAAEAVAAEIDGLAVQADVSTTDGSERLVAAAADLGPVGILVNNAGIADDGLLMRMKDDAWQRVMDTNAGGPFRMCRAVLPAMSRQRGGSIVNIVSVSGLRGNAGQANYAASKAAVIALTRSVALEMGRRNIRVNGVAPGFVETDMTASVSESKREQAAIRIPLRRMGTPEEIAPTVRFLCGPGAAYITGQIIVVDGGLSL